MTDWTRPDEFEARVAHVARALWPSSGVGGAVMFDGRERDGLYVTEECVHAIEATARRDLAKARGDSDKLSDFRKILRAKFPDKAVKLWFVTKDAPTADQRTECLKKDVNPVSFVEFQSRLIDVRSLLGCRRNYRFGSNDEVGPSGLGEKKFVDFGISKADRTGSYSTQVLAEEVASGKRFVLMGDFGAGKSTTLIQVYRILEGRFLRGDDHRFPLFVNLRDHFGQTDGAELLSRHAKRMGFEPGSHIVRAWRAGYCHLLLDGFDEVSPIGATARSALLRNARREALSAVRELIRDQPQGCGLIVSGRQSYFDSAEERSSSLGLKAFTDLLLSDFTDEQVAEYLRHNGLASTLPRWLPKRPYLVATLARKGVVVGGIEQDAGDGWNHLLDSICDREAEISPSVDGRTVRVMLERLATIARRSFDGLGPLAGSEFQQVFRDVCGFEPDDRGYQLLSRLSGLATIRPGEDSRSFIDEHFADACRAGDAARFCISPWGEDGDRLKAAVRALGPTGLAVLDSIVPDNHPEGLLDQALQNGDSATRLDVFQLMNRRGLCLKAGAIAREVAVDTLEVLGDRTHSASLVVADSYVDRVIFEGQSFSSAGIRLVSTNIKEMVGPAGVNDVPEGFLDSDSDVEVWVSEFGRNADVLSSSVDLRVAVLMTMLRKIFLQSGNGRREDALYRGLGPDAQRYVGPILEILERSAAVTPYRKRGSAVWIPNRSLQDRVERIIKSPNVTADEIVSSTKSL